MATTPAPVAGAWRRNPRWAYAVLGLYLLGMVVLVGWPDAWAINRLIVDLYFGLVGLGLPLRFGPDTFAVVLNVLACIPPVAAAVVLFRRVPWWAWVLLGLALSVSVEWAQGFIGRHVDPWDVVANTTGALLGALLGLALTRGRGGRGSGGSTAH